MKGKGRGLPPNVTRSRSARRGRPGSAAILEALKLVQIFLKIGAARDRKRVIELARQLAPAEAGTKP
jgi:hypothetical protein